MTYKRPVVYWLLVVMWGGLIFSLSAVPSLSTGLGVYDLILRKTAHVVEYGILAFLLWQALQESGFVSVPGLSWMVMVLCVLYAVSDEWHQSFVPGRGPSLFDVIIDSVGAGVVCFVRRGKK